MTSRVAFSTLTVPQLADRWQCKSDAVLGLIRSGRLPAFAPRPDSRRPRFRVSMDAVVAYEAGTPKPPPTPARRRRRVSTERQWF